MDRKALLSCLAPWFPEGLSRETTEVLMMAVNDPEEETDTDEWEEGIRDLLADDVGLLDLEEDGKTDPSLSNAVSEAVHRVRLLVSGKR